MLILMKLFFSLTLSLNVPHKIVQLLPPSWNIVWKYMFSPNGSLMFWISAICYVLLWPLEWMVLWGILTAVLCSFYIARFGSSKPLREICTLKLLRAVWWPLRREIMNHGVIQPFPLLATWGNKGCCDVISLGPPECWRDFWETESLSQFQLWGRKNF